ncbi:MAG: phage/plasmid primase, P4 family [Candidatus Thiodiazotropha endolucinida]
MKMENAIEYAISGYKVFPVKPNEKTPAVRGWQSLATRDTEQIGRWWTENQNYNIGVLAEDILVLDIDEKDGKQGSINLRNTMISSGWEMPEGYMEILTPSGGRHQYFRDPSPELHTNKTHAPVEDCDIRAGGAGFVLGVGSMIGGEVYTGEIIPFSLLPEAPSWLCMVAERIPSISNPISTVKSTVDIIDVQKALSMLDPDLGYDEWISIGMALQAEFGDKGLLLWDEWSQKGNKYQGLANLERHWSTFKPEGGITIATLWRLSDFQHNHGIELGNAEKMNDTGLGEEIIRQHDDFHWLAETGSWCVWEDGRWVTGPKTEKLIGGRLNRTLDDLVSQVPGLYQTHPRDATQAMGWLSRCKNQRSREAVFRYLKERTVASVKDFDTNSDLLGLSNGVLDLGFDEFRKMRKEDRITRILNAHYDPQASCPQWMKFLNEALEHDQEMIGYLQRLCGYWLTPDVSEQEIYFFFGSGGTGKSTFLNTISHILGAYAVKVSAESILRNRWGTKSNASMSDLARTMGARMMLTDELPPDGRLDLSIVKSITGDSTITTKLMHKDTFEFEATAKLVMFGNDKPYGDFMDEGLWRRMRLIHFARTVPDGDRDKHLLEKMRAEAAGIINWILEGYRQWNVTGLMTPQKVKEDSAAYRSGFDNVTPFLEEMIEYAKGEFVTSAALYTQYKQWCDENLEAYRKNNSFSKAVKDFFRGNPNVTYEQTRRGRGYQGIALRENGIARVSGWK